MNFLLRNSLECHRPSPSTATHVLRLGHRPDLRELDCSNSWLHIVHQTPHISSLHYLYPQVCHIHAEGHNSEDEVSDDVLAFLKGL